MKDWNEAKAKYLRGSASLRQLAGFLGVSERTVFRRAKAEEWFANRQQIRAEASNVVRETALTTARVLGAELAEQTAEGFRSRTGQTVAILANRLDELAAKSQSAAELKTIAATLRDTWAVGSQLHGLDDGRPHVLLSVGVMSMLPDADDLETVTLNAQ